MAWIEWLNIAASAALAIRLWTSGLWRNYPAFFALFCFFPLPLTLLQFIPRNTNRYAEVYFASVPLHWLFYGAAIYEIFRQVLKDHPGIESFGRWTLAGGVAVSFTVAIASLALEWSSRGQKFPILYFCHLFERAYSTTATLLILLLLAVLLWFPIVLKRNMLYIAAGFGFLFLSKTLALLLRNLAGPGAATVLGDWLQVAFLVCICAWTVMLSPAGERVRSAARRLSSPEETARLMRQLDRMNEALLRAGGSPGRPSGGPRLL